MSGDVIGVVNDHYGVRMFGDTTFGMHEAPWFTHGPAITVSTKGGDEIYIPAVTAKDNRVAQGVKPDSLNH